MIIEYQLARLSNRRIINLRRCASSINLAASTVFGTNLRSTTIFPKYFQMDVAVMPSNSDIRKMGMEIVAKDAMLDSIKTTYSYKRGNGSTGTSTQLFRRKK